IRSLGNSSRDGAARRPIARPQAVVICPRHVGVQAADDQMTRAPPWRWKTKRLLRRCPSNSASEFDRLAQGLRRKLLLCQLALAFENKLRSIEEVRFGFFAM